MKLRYNIFYTIVVGLVFLSCSNLEEVEPEQLEPVEKVHMVLTAHMDMEEPLTKTYLAGEPVVSSRNTYWLPSDEIGVLGLSLGKFTNTAADTSAVAVFEGKSELSSQYYAIYPYPDQNFQSAGDGKLIFNIPEVQKYQKNTFATDVVPMVTKFKSGDELYFKNACGGLVIKVKGVEKIKSMRLVAYEQTGVEAKIAGQCLVDMDAEEYVITPEISASTSISIDCGSGVQLNESEPVAFHFALAPATYHGFRVVMMSEDGKFMVKETDKELNIKRANITYAAPFSFEESESVDLSLRGTSNCYVISEANRYRFNASVIGNGTYGIIPDASFHTSDPSIEPVSVKVLWETNGANIKAAEGEMLSDVILKDGYVHFTSTGKEGNALIAVKDADGNILWSWHIWMTDQPVDQTYVNSTGTFVMQDRNLGAVRADSGSGDEWEESYGAIYQWGRKDPFIKDIYELIRSSNKINGPLSLSLSVQNPTKIGVMNGSATNHPSWLDVKNGKLWTNSTKTIYDPCPVGYKVPDTYVWKGFTWDGNNTSILESISASSVKDHGFDFIYDGVNSTWYPAAPMVNWNGNYHAPDKIGRLWTTVPERSFKYETSPAITFDNTECWENYAIPVRCMKDEGFVDLAMPTVEMVGAKDVTTESATLLFNIKNEGASEVTDAGIIYGTTAGLSLENGIKVSRTSEEDLVELTGLAEGARYYAVAYATNSYGTAYSKEVAFYTEFANCTNLSRYGTSNCYIVSEYGAYTFDASVRGNSTESVGSPASAEVLWETKNTTKASAGEIIRSGSVELSGDFVTFVANGVEGNALIAVKDALGTILWSWHIWVTDQPQDQHYINSLGDFYVLDRNIGAIRKDKGTGDQWKESIGVYYQWGRKDPFVGGLYTKASGKISIETSIAQPTRFPTTYPWMSPTNYELWSSSEKTIYDPCPIGYVVCSDSVWDSFIGQSVNSNNGWELTYDGKNKTWIPAAVWIDVDGNLMSHNYEVYMWSGKSNQSLHIINNTLNTGSWQLNNGFTVRCMREHAVNAELSTTKVVDITKNSATVSGQIKYIGSTAITEMGFVYSSTTESPNINSAKVAVSVTEGAFTKTLTDLKPGTTYYVRTFAAEGNIVIYGNVLSFTTTMSGDIEDIPGDDYEWE